MYPPPTQPPVQSNGPLTDYTLQYRLLREQNDVEFSTLTVGSGSAQTFVLGRLQPLERLLVTTCMSSMIMHVQKVM